LKLLSKLLSVSVLVIIAAPALGADAPAAAKRPNFVFVLIDDLRYDAMSCAGHPFVKTPNIDRLATGGLRFTNAFVTISLCAPSRACFLTGAYSHVNGVRTNEGQEFDPGVFETYPQALQKAGYKTAFVGKWHMAPTAKPRPGFDYWFSFKGQGVYTDPQVDENGKEYKASGYMTDILTEHAVDWLKAQKGAPFSLCLWHKAVHEPFTPAERHKNLYQDARLPEPASFRDTFEGKPAWQSKPVQGPRQQQQNQRRNRRANATGPAATQPTWNPHPERMIDYYRTEMAVDESVERVLATLKEMGQLENTYVIFAGDNGFFQGEHRRGDKRAAYEESIRIPLVMCGPEIKRPGRLVDGMVLGIDVAPTILDLAGVTVPATMQGRSWKPLLAGEAPKWRTSFLYEYFQEKVLSGVPTTLGVRTADWKYVQYPTIDDVDELYDLRRDPHELHNLAADPAAKGDLADMKAELERLLKETKFTDPPRKQR
jgi:N-acetylglucosamine-6-sulfatase